MTSDPSTPGPSTSVVPNELVGAARPTLERRIGTYSTFLERMLERMPKVSVPDPTRPGQTCTPLASINVVNDRRNFVVGLTAAWATVGDVLTFYQERIANESYIGTARTDTARVELSRTVGHALAPGVSATALLAFTVTYPAGQTGPLALTSGIAVQSLVPPTAPGAAPAASPQVFETVESILARPEWNAIALLAPPTVPPSVTIPAPATEAATVQLTVTSPVTPLQSGDSVVLEGTDATSTSVVVVAQVTAVAPGTTGTSAISLIPAAGSASGSLASPTLLRFRRKASILGASAPDWSQLSVDAKRQYAWILGGLNLAPPAAATPRSRAPIHLGLPTASVLAMQVHPSGTVLVAVEGKGVYAADLSDLDALAQKIPMAPAPPPSPPLTPAPPPLPAEPWLGVPTDYPAPWETAFLGLLRREVTCLSIDTQGLVYAGTVGGGVFRSTNAGRSWDDISRGPTTVTSSTNSTTNQSTYATQSLSVPAVTVVAVVGGRVIPGSVFVDAGAVARAAASPAALAARPATTTTVTKTTSGTAGAASSDTSSEQAAASTAVTGAVEKALSDAGSKAPSGLQAAVEKGLAAARPQSTSGTPPTAGPTAAGLAAAVGKAFSNAGEQAPPDLTAIAKTALSAAGAASAPTAPAARAPSTPGLVTEVEKALSAVGVTVPSGLSAAVETALAAMEGHDAASGSSPTTQLAAGLAGAVGKVLSSAGQQPTSGLAEAAETALTALSGYASAGGLSSVEQIASGVASVLGKVLGASGMVVPAGIADVVGSALSVLAAHSAAQGAGTPTSSAASVVQAVEEVLSAAGTKSPSGLLSVVEQALVGAGQSAVQPAPAAEGATTAQAATAAASNVSTAAGASLGWPWETTTTTTVTTTTEPDVSPRQVVFAATTAGLFASPDNGSTWYPFTGQPAGEVLRGVAIDEAQGLVYAGTTGGLYTIMLQPVTRTGVTTTITTTTTVFGIVVSESSSSTTVWSSSATNNFTWQTPPIVARQVTSLLGTYAVVGTVGYSQVVVAFKGSGLQCLTSNTSTKGTSGVVNQPTSTDEVTAVAMWSPGLWSSLSPAAQPAPILRQVMSGQTYSLQSSIDAGKTWTALTLDPPLPNAPAAALALAGDSSVLVSQPYIGFDPDEWPGMRLDDFWVNESSLEPRVDLSSLEPAVLAGSCVLFTPSPDPAVGSAPSPPPATSAQAFSVVSAQPVTVTRFGVTQTVTRLALEPLGQAPAETLYAAGFSPGNTVVSLASEPVPLVKTTPDPQTDVLAPSPLGLHLTLASAIPAMEVGRTLIIQGKPLGVSLPAGAPLCPVMSDGTVGPPVTSIPTPLYLISSTTAAANPAGTPPVSSYSLTDQQGQRYALQTTDPSTVTLVFSTAADPVLAEVVELGGDPQDPAISLSSIALAASLSRAYDARTVTVLGNIVEASHGATVSSRVIGSGNASQTFQQFTLPDSNLTMLPGPPGSDPTSTLIVAVGGVAWTEVEDLNTCKATDTSYALQHNPDGSVAVCFGDGVHGARLPTGTGNVTASYRTGSGPNGHLGPNTLTVPLRRPRGVIGTTNPLATTEAQAGEAPADAVSYVLSAGQVAQTIVTQQDYLYVTQSIAGVAKVHVGSGNGGGRRRVRITIARSPGTSLGAADDLAFAEAVRDYLDANTMAQERRSVWLSVEIAATRYFGVATTLAYAEEPSGDESGPAVVQALIDAFDFDARALGQDVTMAEVLAVIQGTAGVRGAYLQYFDYVSGPDAPAPTTSFDPRGLDPGTGDHLTAGRVPLWLPASDPSDGAPVLLLFGGARSVVLERLT